MTIWSSREWRNDKERVKKKKGTEIWCKVTTWSPQWLSAFANLKDLQRHLTFLQFVCNLNNIQEHTLDTGFTPATSLTRSHIMKHTHRHSVRRTNHQPLFSGPVCEWDFHGREGGGGRRQEAGSAAFVEIHLWLRRTSAPPLHFLLLLLLFFSQFSHTLLMSGLVPFSFSFSSSWTLWLFLCRLKILHFDALLHQNSFLFSFSFALFHWLITTVLPVSTVIPLSNNSTASVCVTDIWGRWPPHTHTHTWTHRKHTENIYLQWENLCPKCFWILSDSMKSLEPPSSWGWRGVEDRQREKKRDRRRKRVRRQETAERDWEGSKRQRGKR